MDLLQNKSNAAIVKEVSTPIVKLGMVRYESLFDIVSEEPYRINVKLDERSEYICFEQVLRVRRWGIDSCYAWYIYSKERIVCDKDDIIIRKLVWDKKHDKKKQAKFVDIL